MIEPIMGTKELETPETVGLANALFPKTRQRVLAIFYAAPDRSFYANEVIALAGSGSGAVQRELIGLSQAGLLSVRKQGNQTHYQANPDSPVFAELRSLVMKTMGLADVLRDALMPLAPLIDAAFVYGSVARQQDTAGSDVDVLIISATLGYADVFNALRPAATALGRKVNPTLYQPIDMARRISEENAFITRVLQQPKIWLIGREEQLHASFP
ncbi:MAG: transcriptional regulator [Comamonadaceae bacterium]|nr:MAG: transcriptional regulator [Comamonadaceae bacterium]